MHGNIYIINVTFVNAEHTSDPKGTKGKLFLSQA